MNTAVSQSKTSLARPGGNAGKPKTSWTFENVKKEALKFTSRFQWSILSSTSYDVARRAKWVDKVTEHMKASKEKHPMGYWNFERCKKEALKYKKRTHWAAYSNTSYNTA